MHPEIEATKAALFTAIRGLSADEAGRTVDGQWSIAGIVEHLSLSYTRSAAALRRRTEKGDVAPARTSTFRQQFQQFVVVSLGYLPPGRSTPEATRPAGRPFPEVVDELDRVFVELDASLTSAAKSLGASRAVLDHPILGPFSVNQWRKFHLIHTRHHAKQIRARRS